MGVESVAASGLASILPLGPCHVAPSCQSVGPVQRIRAILPALLLLAAVECRAEEPSLVDRSTFVGANFGFATGSSQPLGPAGQLSLAAEVDIYLRNLELTEIGSVKGETFFAFMVPVRLRYRAHEQLTLEVGVFLRHDFGDPDEFNAVDPLIRLVYETANDVYFIAGSILPTHWIHDALHHQVQRYRTPAEQGLQFRIDHAAFKEDIWINWRIRETDVDPEEFEIGNATRGLLFDERLWLDFQFLVAHAGGQMNSSGRVESNVSGLLGATYGIPFGRPGQEVRFGGRYFLSLDHIDNVSSVNGNGWEAIVSVLLRPNENILLRVYGTYYQGEDMLAQRGNPLYGFDNYAQLAVDAVFDAAGDLQIELGFVAQFTDNVVNYTFWVTFAWGHDFKLVEST